MPELLCLACYGNRLASLYEGATDFQLFRVGDDHDIYPAGQISLPSRDPLGRASLFCSCGVNLVLCGAISEGSRQVLEENGIEVVPWIRGEIQEVLSAWLSQEVEGLKLPGAK
jgi:predicted Fe-Mo cluster-binding NifX family protein